MFTVAITPEVTVQANATDEELAEFVNTYRALDTKGKAAARKRVDDSMRTALMDSDLVGAQFAARLGKMLVSAKPTAEPIDAKAILANAVAEYELAAQLLRDGHMVPKDLDVEGLDYAEIEWINLDTVSLDSPIGAAAVAFATSKRSNKVGDRVDIGQAILSAFDGMDSGAFLTVSEIANKSGALTGPIAARLFPVTRGKNGTPDVPRECTVEGIKAGRRDGDTGPKGAFLV